MCHAMGLWGVNLAAMAMGYWQMTWNCMAKLWANTYSMCKTPAGTGYENSNDNDAM